MAEVNLEERSIRILLFTILVLAIILSRALWIDQISFDSDEARTATRAQGNILQIIAWQPSDWPPLHNILIGAWSRFTSPHPKILRFSSFLMFLPGLALTYQFAQHLFRNTQAAWGATVALAALGSSSFLSAYLRGYGLALALTPLLFLLTLRYFEQPKARYRALYLALVIALLVYTTYVAVAAFIIIGLYTIAKYRWQNWRWWLPVTLTFLLVLPEVLYKASFFANKVSSTEAQALSFMPPLSGATVNVLQQFTGPLWFVWLLLLVMSCVLVIRYDRPLSLKNIWILGTILAAPIVLYLAYWLTIVSHYEVRYIYWGGLFIALLIGAGLAYVPRWICYAVLLVLLLLMPFPHMPRPLTRNNGFEHDLAQLERHYLPGDVMVIDPAICLSPDCSFLYEWSYYIKAYLGNRWRVVDEPRDVRRVWYVHIEDAEDLTMQAAAQYGRVQVQSIGRPDLTMTLYQGAPDPQGIVFENGLRFHGFDILNLDGIPQQNTPELFERDAVMVRLWWSIDHTLEQEYSISLQLLDESQNLIAQVDQAPALMHLNPENPRSLPHSMTNWEIGQLYVEQRLLELPNLENPLRGQLVLVVYQWWDNQRLMATGLNENQQLPLTDVLVFGY